MLKSKQSPTGNISTLPGEGKPTILANHARIIAHGGSRAVLINADHRNPTLSVLLGYEGLGLIDVLAGWQSVNEALLRASEAMKKLIASPQETYDYVIVGLPPLIPVVDARASTNFIDSHIYVIEWSPRRRTSANTVV